MPDLQEGDTYEEQGITYRVQLVKGQDTAVDVCAAEGPKLKRCNESIVVNLTEESGVKQEWQS